MKKCLIIVTILYLWGCGAILNPYKDDFSCPGYDKGKCIKVSGAYKESLQKKKNDTLSEKENKAACEKCGRKQKTITYLKRRIAPPVHPQKQTMSKEKA
jgi:hypothetical protein